MFTEVKTVHAIAKTLAEIQKTLGSASVLARQGNLDVEASVERYACRIDTRHLTARAEPQDGVLTSGSGMRQKKPFCASRLSSSIWAVPVQIGGYVRASVRDRCHTK
jgi:hypothetical protein